MKTEHTRKDLVAYMEDSRRYMLRRGVQFQKLTRRLPRPGNALLWNFGKRLDATEHGLDATQAAAGLTEFGPHELPQKPPAASWQIVLRQFRNPLIYILAVAAVVSVAIGDVKDAAYIAGVLVLHAVIGTYQEWKAERSSRALRQLLQIRASVYRDGDVREVNAQHVVPGDVVWLESGNRVPADIRLLSAHGLEVDESLLSNARVISGIGFQPVSGNSTGWKPIPRRKTVSYFTSAVNGRVAAGGQGSHLLRRRSHTGRRPVKHGERRFDCDARTREGFAPHGEVLTGNLPIGPGCPSATS